MKQRMNYAKVAPDAFQCMVAFEKYLSTTDLNKSLLELVKIRASQLNGCAFCLDMHTLDARAKGETEQRIYALNAWRETDFYTEQERAALSLTEAITLISNKPISDELYEDVRTYFDERNFIDLVYAINTINAWNRLAIVTRAKPGEYKPQ